MRPPLLLFLTVTVLVSCASAVSTGNAAELRSLRSIKTTTNDDAAEEERGGFYHKFDLNFLDDIFHGLPEQFQRMRNQPERLRTMFENWKTGWMSVDDAVAYMTREGLSEKAISQFKAAYQAYLKHKG
ncbi:hypothetical protein L914_01796 [Phytophthora nicotianae]|uniref:Secreted RxLR effector protein 3 n=1 Tax=Phytophthora nicotianae TaxID=4792 RepID=RXLR3_PHYNI|nr:RecName: Full=Secreted RxLR effector protein 3; Flags: Precursor [Phytophthora nicotianae]ETM54925.1 hypothetical protein L914_01796 [Phytophthora nicotianae]